MALTAKQHEFILQYLSNGYNATKAYEAAYESDYITANKNAYRVLNNPEVKRQIQEQQDKHYRSLEINAEHIAEELAAMAFAEKGDKDYSASVKLKALDLLQKQLGLQRQKVEADVNTDINITITE